jgi:hypothetical protein
MAKDKNIFLKTAFLILPIYFIFLLDDFYNFDDHGVFEIIDARSQYLQEFRNTNSIILGGSNALWGISAAELNESSGNNFYNLSMHSNGVNYKNYFEYILESLKFTPAENIDLIVWSTIHTYLEPPYNDFDRDIAGRLRLSKLIPNQSLLSKIYKSLSSQESLQFEVSRQSGDFLFDNFKCPLSDKRYLDDELIKKISNEKYDFAPLAQLEDQINMYKFFFKNHFPASKIVFVVPSILNPPNISPDEQKFLEKIFEDKNFYLFIQEPISDVTSLCESSHHPNSKGRSTRTNEINNFLETNKLLKSKLYQ